MSLRILWRSAVFVITLGFIYLAFPILIVPSSLPAIKALFVEEKYPEEDFVLKDDGDRVTADAQIYELNIPEVLTLSGKINVLKGLHQQGMALILPKD